VSPPPAGPREPSGAPEPPRAADPHAGTRFLRLGPAPADARLTTILVHGRDQDDAVTRDLAARLEVPDIAHVLPVAAGRSWYPGRYFDPLATLEPHLSSALAALDRAVREARVPDERLVLVGFSQGACLVAEYLARQGPRRFHGAAILTGCLLGTPRERAEPRIARNLPVVLASSRHDDWIALPDALDTAARFRRAGAALAVTELDDRVHHISDRAVAATRSLLLT
jgi:phospholipase/carboxylesterase